MRKIQQLSYHERRQIYSSLCQQKSKRSIAKILGRSISTVTQEIKRKSDRFGYFYPESAHQSAQKRKHINKPKIDRKVKLQSFIEEKLRLR